jgi:hypothetical protein
MVYPLAPWKLEGCAFQTLQLMDSHLVRSPQANSSSAGTSERSLVPAELEIIEVWPGKTLGSVYLATYGSGSTLEYHELIVASALVRYAGKWGFWVSHIYVDHPDSLAGGREIWGLPKELAEFDWPKEKNGSILVHQGDRQLCCLSHDWQSWMLPQKLSGAVFSGLNTELLWFKAEVKAQIGFTRAQLTVPPESPFAEWRVDQPWLTFGLEAMTLVVDAPQTVGEKATASILQ